jgi:hypothetical protein
MFLTSANKMNATAIFARRYLGAISLYLFLGAASAPAIADNQALLQQAWDEYGLQAFPNAASLFDQVEDSAEATGPQLWQARLGLAFVTHYQMPGRDPEAAIPLYQELLREVDDDTSLRGLVLARLGDAHAESAPQRLDDARRLYRQAIEILPATSLMAQETALRLLTTFMEEPDPAGFVRGLEVADELAERLRGTAFESVFYGLQVELAFFAGNYPGMARALLQQYKAGINNVQVKEKVLFQLARLNETELGDYAAAEHYYRLLAKEVPSSLKAYFARLRADELAAGKLDSDYAPPLSTKVTDPTVQEDIDGR